MLGEVGRRTYHRHALVGADAHRDHVFVDALAEANTRVIAARDNVGQTIVDVDLDCDVGIVPPQLLNSRPENSFRSVVTRGEPKFARRPIAQFGQCRQCLVDAVEMRGDGVQQSFTGFRRRHIAGGARQQLKAQALFKPAHGVA